MGSIWVTGDIHADPSRFSVDNFPEQEGMTKEDVIVILGDFGLLWDYRGESSNEKYWLNWLNDKPFTTLFVDGNHECYDRLYKYPLKKWHEGMVHEIRPSVLHLCRGEIFNINDKKCLAFGGARSHDIHDGILEPDDKETIKAWRKDYTKMFRINHRTWWAEEMPLKSEMYNAIYNLSLVNNQVNFIFTHDCAASTKALIGHGCYEIDELNKFLEEIRCTIDFKKWFFGHLHDNMQINDKEILLYEQIIRIA